MSSQPGVYNIVLYRGVNFRRPLWFRLPGALPETADGMDATFIAKVSPDSEEALISLSRGSGTEVSIDTAKKAIRVDVEIPLEIINALTVKQLCYALVFYTSEPWPLLIGKATISNEVLL